MYPHADSELRSALCEQLVALLDIYLGGYVAQLTSLQQRPPGAQQERYNSLEMEYSQRRSELLAPLREFNTTRYVVETFGKILGWHGKKQRRLAEQQSCFTVFCICIYMF